MSDMFNIPRVSSTFPLNVLTTRETLSMRERKRARERERERENIHTQKKQKWNVERVTNEIRPETLHPNLGLGPFNLSLGFNP